MNMINNLFSIFDPSVRLIFSINWLSILIFLTFLPSIYWLIPSRPQILILNIYKILLKEFNPLIIYSKSNSIIFISIFLFILRNNLWGLVPYIFTPSSHLSFCLSISLSLWTGMILYGWVNFCNHIFTHLTPIGTPNILIPIIVLIELIRLIIRPITLSIRLTANIIAGHLLLSLLGSSGTSLRLTITTIILLPSQFLLLTLEISVSLIQAYVFSILSTLYRSEI